MRWLKRERWKASLALAGMLLLLILMVWVPVSAAGADESASGLATPGTGMGQATPTEDATVTALDKEKLKGDVTQQQHTLGNWFWNNGTALFSSLALILGGIFTVVRYFSDREAERDRRDEEQQRWLEDRKAEREKRDEEQQRWLKNQEAEREKQAEERFQQIVEGLGSERTEAKVGAAITLRTFLQPGYERFYRQAFDLAVAHLRLRKAEASAPAPPSSPAPVLIVPKGDLRQEQQPPPPTASIPLDSLSQALLTGFKESFPLARNELKKTNAQFDPHLLDASYIRLDQAYLDDADLAKVELAYASLREAYLFGAHLEEASLFGAHLEGARLPCVYLERANLMFANLERVDFFGAPLESTNLADAHLEGASLIGANLEGTDLHGAHLEGADLTEANLEAATFLMDAQMKGVVGFTPEQREACIKKGAIFDEVQQAATSDTSSPSSLPSGQSNDTQVPSSPSAQVNTPLPDTGGNGAASSKLGSES